MRMLTTLSASLIFALMVATTVHPDLTLTVPLAAAAISLALLAIAMSIRESGK